MPPGKRKKGDEPDFKVRGVFDPSLGPRKLTNQKAKLKLGKGKKVPTNATNTSFKARSIALPDQQPFERAAAQQDPSSNFAATPEGAEPLTASGLNLDDVLIRLRHPNAGVRRDGLGGVKEILKIRSGGEVGKVMRALGGIISDEDASVRKGLLSLLDWYFSITPEVRPSLQIPRIQLTQQTSLAPHLPLFLLLTSSALSHIFSDIRLDAARLVTLLLTHVPAHVTSGWPTSSTPSTSEGATTTSGSTILEGLRLALGLGGENASSAQGRLTAGGKLVFLKAVLGFVGVALDRSGGGSRKGMWDGWIEEEKSGNGGGAVEIGEHGVAYDGTEGWLVGLGNWATSTAAVPEWELGRLEASSSRAESGDDTSSVVNLFTQLHPLLLSTFLESAPSAFSPSSTSTPSTSTETHIDLCVVTTSLTTVLAKHIITSSTSEKDTGVVRARISDFLKRLSTYFPFTSPSLASSSASGLGAGLELNLSYARLAALLAPQPTALVFVPQTGGKKETAWKARSRAVEAAWVGMRAETERRKAKGKGKAVEGWAMEEVATWVADLLTPSQDISTPPISPSTLSALLPIIWTLIIQPPPSSSSEDATNIPDLVGSAFFSFLSRQSASSNLRAIGDEFIINLLRIHEQPYPTLPFFVSANSELRAQVRGWIEGVPKALWELGGRDERGTERLLRWLLDMGMRGAGSEEGYSLLDGKVYPGLSARLAPFFHLSHPTRGSTMGPWTKLQDPKVRKLGLDVAEVWKEWDSEGRLQEAVRAAVAVTSV